MIKSELSKEHLFCLLDVLLRKSDNFFTDDVTKTTVKGLTFFLHECRTIMKHEVCAGQGAQWVFVEYPGADLPALML
jgi:hypothetical protein